MVFVSGSRQNLHTDYIADCDLLAKQLVNCFAHRGPGISRFLYRRDDIERDVDWDVMDLEFWNDTDVDGDRERRRQAEFLVGT